MDSMSIAIGALNAAKVGLDVAGNNIANAATEGYHRQRVEFSPAYSSEKTGFLLGGGVEVDNITRLVDSVLEKQIIAQNAMAGQTSTELDTISSVESAFGELSGEGGLSATIDSFFTSLQSLSGDPTSQPLQTQVLKTGQSMVEQFRTLGSFLTDLSTSILDKAQTAVKQINELAGQIADLNGQIRDGTLHGATTNNLKDQRDARITDLSNLVGISTVERDDGTVDVTVGGSWLVVDESVQKIQVAVQEGGLLGIAPEGSPSYTTELDGGQLGAYFSLSNTTLASVKNSFDTLARSIIDSVNSYHVQGVGADGSFTDLQGTSLMSQNLSELDPPVTDGDVYIRVTDTETGKVTRTRVSVSPSDSLSDMASKLDAVDGVSAQVEAGRLHITADNGYEFDFAPALGTPPADSISGSLVPSSLSGIYEGSSNDTWTLTVVGSGQVGNCTDPLKIRVTNSTNELIAEVSVGSDYTPGDTIELPDGIRMKLDQSNLVAGDSFSVDVITNSDTSGFLAATGLNTFFSGTGASDMAISDSVADLPGRVASSLGTGTSDSANSDRMCQLVKVASSSLGSASIGDYYQNLVTDIGRDVSLKNLRVQNIEAVTQSLKNQQESHSGVDINDEASKMLIFEQMFQASARYLTTVQSTMDELMKIL
jgi:flagellar hook-associated protein 1